MTVGSGTLAASYVTKPSCAAVVLAAGTSTRMAPHHKLLVEDGDGRTMIARTVANVLASRVRPVVVVTGARASDIRNALAGEELSFVHATDFAEGIAASLRAGIRALPALTQGAIIFLGDMPLVPGHVLDRLESSYSPAKGRTIIVPTYKGQGGNPVLWGASFFPELLALTGDQGARRLLTRYPGNVAEVDVADEGVLRDFDTMESLATLPEQRRPR